MSKIVTVYGGSGFIGRQIARRMAKQGWRVRVAVRRPSEALFVRTYGAVGQVEPVPCNIRDETSVLAAMADAEAVVNCVGILVSEGKNRFDTVQAEGAARIARLASETGVKRLSRFPPSAPMQKPTAPMPRPRPRAKRRCWNISRPL